MPHHGLVSFDICFLNDIAVANSGLIREYSLVDPRVKDLMLAVKRWTKAYNINSAKDNFISSYAWMNMVVFYLQCLGFVPNLQCRKLMQKAGLFPNPEGNYWESVNNLDTCFLKWEQVQQAHAWQQPDDLKDLSVSALLYGFFEFYSKRFPFALFAIAIKRGDVSLPKLVFPRRSLFFCIEDPFETYESHCPHDLGTPANESGARHVLKYLREAEAHLRGVLLGKIPQESLWPTPNFVEPQPPRSAKKNAQFKRFSNAGRESSVQKVQPNDAKRQQASVDRVSHEGHPLSQSPGQPTHQQHRGHSGSQPWRRKQQSNRDKRQNRVNGAINRGSQKNDPSFHSHDPSATDSQTKQPIPANRGNAELQNTGDRIKKVDGDRSYSDIDRNKASGRSRARKRNLRIPNGLGQKQNESKSGV